MKSKLLFTLLLTFVSFIANAQDTVTVNSSIQYQTIVGWGHGGSVFGGLGSVYTLIDTSFASTFNYQYLDYLIDDLGLTGSRTWETGPRIDGTGMDNGDCDSIDWSKFQPDNFFPWQWDYCVYFKNRILAKGFQPTFYSSPTYPTGATILKPWVMNHPGERAQQIWANALYLKNTYGININYAVIFNEPNVSASLIADDIKALGPRFISHGLPTKVQYAEAVTPQTNWNYITQVQNDSDMWAYVGRISYHIYGTADPFRNNMRDFAKTRGLTTAQTEMANPTFDDLYGDLTLADASYWEVGFSSSNILVPKSGLTSFTPSSTFFRLRQVMHYVRPGAVRIETTTNDASLHVLAFLKNGAITTIIENTSGASKTVYLRGLPPGNYGLSRAQSSAISFQELGIQTVGADGSITLNVNGGSTATTLYPYSGTNQPPTIMTFISEPGYIVAPTSTATLTCTANDAELNPLTYHWAVINQPFGASATLATANAATTSVSGLTIAGNYIFKIEVTDGVNTSSKLVYLVKYDSNPPPILGSAGFRINAPYGLVFGKPGDTTHANVELPTSSVMLQVGISDLANSDFSGRGQWSLVSSPPSATVTIGNTIYIYVSIRAQASGMTVPGDYVFHCEVTNPGHPNLTAQIICTVHPASSAPVINSITPSPAIMTLPVSASLLTALTSDPEADLLRHWWVVKSAPVGAKPVFEHQGLAVSNVSGLTVPGNYTFTLRAFDDIHITTKDATVTVNPPSNTITILSIPSKYCQGEGFSLPYQITGAFLAGNIFTAQLSDATGSFANPIEIGEINSTSSGIISAAIPKNTNAASGYRMRVVSSNPAVMGTENGSNLTINTLPVPVIQGSAAACSNSTQTFSAVAELGHSFKWTATGGNIVGADHQNSVLINWITTNPSGTVTLTETIDATGCSDYISQVITLNPLPAPAIQGTLSACRNSIQKFTTIPTLLHSYKWAVDGGIIIGANGRDSVFVNWATSNPSGTVTLTETIDATGCYSSTSKTITINPLPTPSISGLTTVCSSSTQDYSTPQMTGHSYQWSVTEGSIIGAKNQNTVQVCWNTTNNNGTITLQETIDATGCSESRAQNILINSLPIVAITGPLSVQKGSAQSYSGPSSGIVSYEWHVSGGIISGTSNSQDVEVNWGNSGTGTVKLICANSSGCTDSLQKIISINNSNLTITGSGTACEQSTTSFSTPLISGRTNNWTAKGGAIVGSSTDVVVQIRWGTSGNGSVTLVQTIEASQLKDTAAIIIIISPLPQATITGQEIAVKGVLYTYTANPTDGSYQWEAFNGTIDGLATDQTVDITWESGDTGIAKVTETNKEGCSDSASLDVTIVTSSVRDNSNTQNLILKIIPNPVNYKAKIEITANEAVYANIQIFNSYGRIVKEFGNILLQPGTQNIDWDGKDINGETIPSGIYFIKLSSKYGVEAVKAAVVR